MTFDTVRKIALALDEVEEASSYGAPAFKVRGMMIARLREEIGALVLRIPSIDDRGEMMAADPETYFITDHYLNYPYILVNLARIQPEAVRDLLRAAWRVAMTEKRAAKKRTGRGKLGGNSPR